MITAALVIFQAWMWVGVSVGNVCLLSKLDTWLDHLIFNVNVLPKGGTLKPNLFDFYIFCIYSLLFK